MANKQNPKRKLSDQDLDCNFGNGISLLPKSENWQRFILLESLQSDMPLSKLSPFAIQKGISGIAGTVKDCKKLRSGQILVECSKKVQAENLLRANMLAGVAMKTFHHPTLNHSKGVIRTRELEDMEETEITTELMTQDVIHVKRITIRREDRLIKTGTYILTFSRPLPPEKIRIGYLSVNVDIFTPNPLRCFSCQKFGHGSISCKNRPTCVNCGEEKHGDQCKKTPKCSNCAGEHPSSSKDCPTWIKEKEIQKIKCTKKVSYLEARKLVENSSFFKLEKTFAAVMKPKLQSVGVQTDLMWINEKFEEIKSQTPVNTKCTDHQSQTVLHQTQVNHKEHSSTGQHSSKNKNDKKPNPQKEKTSQEYKEMKTSSSKDIEMSDDKKP